MVNLQQIVRTHQPDKPVLSLNIRQLCQRIGRVSGAEPCFGIANMNTRISGRNFFGGRHTLLERRHAVRGFERVLRRYQPPYLVEAQQLKCLFAYI